MFEVEDKIKQFVYSQMSEPDVYLSERKLAERFNLSRATVREIFLGLEGEGLLKRIPNRGYRCVDYDSSDRQSIYTVRYAIEHEAVRKGIEQASSIDLAHLLVLLREMEQALEKGNLDDFAKADMNFHITLVKSSKDNFLIRIFNFMLKTVFKFNRNNKQTAIEALHSHKEIYKYFEKKDWKNTQTALKEHIGKSVSL